MVEEVQGEAMQVVGVQELMVPGVLMQLIIQLKIAQMQEPMIKVLHQVVPQTPVVVQLQDLHLVVEEQVEQV